jgi:hypothetical protein
VWDQAAALIIGADRPVASDLGKSGRQILGTKLECHLGSGANESGRSHRSMNWKRCRRGIAMAGGSRRVERDML